MIVGRDDAVLDPWSVFKHELNFSIEHLEAFCIDMSSRAQVYGQLIVVQAMKCCRSRYLADWHFHAMESLNHSVLG